MSRRIAREVAFRTLFQLDTGNSTPEEALEFALKTTALATDLVPFAEKLVQMALSHQTASDEIISARSVDWRLERLPRVDRSILRLAIGEMLADIGTPIPAIINEAVELANRYGADDSGRFINGLLGGLVRDD